MHLVLMPGLDKNTLKRGEKKYYQGTPRGTALTLIASGTLHLGLIKKTNSPRNENAGKP